MIKISKTYHLALTEQQAQELYELLRTEKDSGCLTPDKELVQRHLKQSAFCCIIPL